MALYPKKINEDIENALNYLWIFNKKYNEDSMKYYNTIVKNAVKRYIAKNWEWNKELETYIHKGEKINKKDCGNENCNENCFCKRFIWDEKIGEYIEKF